VDKTKKGYFAFAWAGFGEKVHFLLELINLSLCSKEGVAFFKASLWKRSHLNVF
jgi:hypothetical protein